MPPRTCIESSEAQASCSWLAGGSSQRQAVAQATLGIGQSAAWPAMAGHIGPVFHMASHVHVPLKQTPCEEQPLGQGVWPTAAPRRAKADSRQLERAGLAGRTAAIALEAEERAIGGMDRAEKSSGHSKVSVRGYL